MGDTFTTTTTIITTTQIITITTTQIITRTETTTITTTTTTTVDGIPPSYYDYLWSVVLRIDADAKHFELCRLEFLASLEGRLSLDSEELRQYKSVLNDVVLKKTLQLRSLLADARKKGTISFQRMVSRILVTDESTGFETLINGNEFDKVLRE